MFAWKVLKRLWQVLKRLLAALLTAWERVVRTGAFRLPPT